MNAFKKPDQGQLNVEADQSTKDLNQEHFSLSLLKGGLPTQRISQAEVEFFQLQIMDILKDLIMRYTKGESTSVTVDVAENILNSLFYSIDAGLQSLNDTEAALNVIKSGNVRQAYDQGLVLVSACVKKSKALYLKLRKSRLKVGLEAYDLTIDEGLALFFDKYGAVFDAHHTMASIDYPLLFDDMSLKGVFYIKGYLETLSLEERFCKLFPDEEIKKVLAAYGRIYKIDYTKTLTNIFELVLNAAFFAALSEEDPITLVMSEDKYRILDGKLDEISSFELDVLIDEGIKKVIDDFEIKEKKLAGYILKYKDIFKTRLASALETDSLKTFILLEDELSLRGQKTIFIDGESMSNESFRELVGRLTKEPDVSIKVSLISSEVDSMEDFIDILEGSCFFGEEYFYLFSRLSDYVLALLAGGMFSDEMRDGPVDISKAISFGIATEAEWQELLVEFLGTIKSEKLKSIQLYMNELRPEEA
jgi:hypothetical protein